MWSKDRFSSIKTTMCSISSSPLPSDSGIRLHRSSRQPARLGDTSSSTRPLKAESRAIFFDPHPAVKPGRKAQIWVGGALLAGRNEVMAQQSEQERRQKAERSAPE